MLRACINCYGSYTTDSVFQWDQNHELEITGLGITEVTGVHFCNRKRDTAIVVVPTINEDSIIVPVPNELLQEPINIIAYVHIYDQNKAKTIEIINIPLVKRPKPDDYQFIQNVDVMSFERLEKDIADFIALVNSNYKAFTSETTENYEEFTEATNNTITAHKKEVDTTLAERKTEMDTTLQLCRDAVTALQLEYRNLDGGTPTTEEELYDDSYNGGYPVANN